MFLTAFHMCFHTIGWLILKSVYLCFSCCTSQFNPAEAVALASKVTNPEGTAKFAGVNYIVINSEPGLVLRGRKGSTGIIISKTQTALVIGLYDNNDVLPGDASKCVETIGEYLASNVSRRHGISLLIYVLLRASELIM